MVHLTRKDIDDLDRFQRIALMNSSCGYRAANLIGTVSSSGKTNLAIFSSVFHLGSNPPLLGMISRPLVVERHTYENMANSGVYTINHISEEIIEKAHWTSAKFDRNTSEFGACGLEEEYLDDFKAPYVASSPVKIGLRLVEEYTIRQNKTVLLVGEVVHLYFEESTQLPGGEIDLEKTRSVALSGPNRYHIGQEVGQHPYAHLKDLPSFPQ